MLKFLACVTIGGRKQDNTLTMWYNSEWFLPLQDTCERQWKMDGVAKLISLAVLYVHLHCLHLGSTDLDYYNNHVDFFGGTL